MEGGGRGGVGLLANAGHEEMTTQQQDHEQPVKLGMLWQILAERDRNATANANAKIDMFSNGFQIGSASWGELSF